MPNLSIELCGKLAKSVIVGVHLLRWIVTYPVDKVIRSLNNWGLNSRLDVRKNEAFSCIGVKTWNETPNDLKT